MIKVHCPICDRVMAGGCETEWPQFPFCSERCRLIDLGRWLGEEYRFTPETEGTDPADEHEQDDVP